TKRFSECLPDGERNVFDRVMRVDMEITGARHFKIEQSVASKQVEHVIEESDTGCDLRSASAIEVDLNLHVSFSRCSSFLSGPRHTVSRIQVLSGDLNLDCRPVGMRRIWHDTVVDVIHFEIKR